MTTNPTSKERVNAYLAEQASLDTLRFITCGSVDDGKSTLIGRMLYEAQMIFEDQVSALKNESKKIGTQGRDIDFALLVDGLAAEREQGITIDVAYRFFSTDRRKFIVADTPGHEQYTRNMVTGASTADVAVILIDARQGVLTQTRRHSMICSVLGIKHVVLAINKMDIVGYSQKTYEKVEADYRNFANELDFDSITPIPMSALKGDNVVERSKHTEWFHGPTLAGYLETVDTRSSESEQPFRMPVQWVNRPNQDFRGLSGTVEAGSIAIDQPVRILPSGETANIKNIILFKNELKNARAGQAITVTLDKEIDASRGDVIAAADSPCQVSDQFEMELVWMDREPGYIGRSYLMKIGTALVNAQITDIKHKFNINTFDKLSASKLELNDLSVVKIKTDRMVPYESYRNCAGLGGLILIDRISNQTVAAGMIKFALRRASNVHQHKLDVDKSARRRLNGHSSKVLWFTGLSGSGKSTIANALEKELHAKGIRTYILDGDNIRHGLNKDLGFTDADRIENIRRISEVAKLMVDAGIVVITAFISPFRAERQMAREMFDEGEFSEVYINTPIEVAESRDPKGLYKKARKGELPNFTGIGSPYEAPETPDFILNTEDKSVDALVSELMESMEF
ncbi:sulfate adenylyltransferase subunit CysN [Neptuniibacter caesariensis]|uniref:Multifunctional fusion protein n=1 Tax=Neptuniibacter caesariensis TaxID=207954 RepID=A0A7U8C4A8_NEPCE|nr:sulfate adenylyltransferase subunit CysN [Neptuniibacter caesariensis]EAR60511.1 binfunctional sulfate adenylyltransferase subunit 1/adenylylsulfate kinase protein [Oceanospirillum sp. MED92] [Neptuniibacter caesariensis]